MLHGAPVCHPPRAALVIRSVTLGRGHGGAAAAGTCVCPDAPAWTVSTPALRCHNRSNSLGAHAAVCVCVCVHTYARRHTWTCSHVCVHGTIEDYFLKSRFPGTDCSFRRGNVNFCPPRGINSNRLTPARPETAPHTGCPAVHYTEKFAPPEFRVLRSFDPKEEA